MSDDDQWVKALGIDYGTVRIGLATSDDLGFLAHPLKTVSGKAEDNPAKAITDVVEERGIRDIVIGMPFHTDGRESTMSREVRKFIVKLRKVLGEDFPIHEVDELMTSKIAKDKLQQSGKKIRDIKAEGLIDQAAAVEILQDWLNAKAPDIELLSEPE